jgi:hypothetical protein
MYPRTIPAHFKNGPSSHFHFRHWNAIIHFLNKGLLHLPRCPNCLIFYNNANTAAHQHTDTCIIGTLRHQHCIQQYHNELAKHTSIMNHNPAVENVDTFKYLGCHLSATSNDIPAISYNLKNAKKTWDGIKFFSKGKGPTKRLLPISIKQMYIHHYCMLWKLGRHQMKPTSH